MEYSQALVDVTFCPYTFGASAIGVDAVDAALAGTVIMLGGASDSSFIGNCVTVEKICFGFFATGLHYVATGIRLVDGTKSRVADVAIIVNRCGLSRWVSAWRCGFSVPMGGSGLPSSHLGQAVAFSGFSLRCCASASSGVGWGSNARGCYRVQPWHPIA